MSDFKGSLVKIPWLCRQTNRRGTVSSAIRSVTPDALSEVDGLPGLEIFSFELPSLPGSSGPPVQFVIKTTADYQTLARVLEQLQAEAWKSGYFIFVDSDLKFDNPQVEVKIDRERAGLSGVTAPPTTNFSRSSTGSKRRRARTRVAILHPLKSAIRIIWQSGGWCQRPEANGVFFRKTLSHPPRLPAERIDSADRQRPCCRKVPELPRVPA